MADSDPIDNIFKEGDTNQDGRLDENEFRNLLTNNERVTSENSEASKNLDDLSGTTNRHEAYRYTGTSTLTTDLADEIPMKSTGVEETNRILQKLGSTVYTESYPKTVRRPAIEPPVTYEQRIMLRCLQPPLLPPPEPLIIKEVRPPQPPLPPPLVIREHGSCTSQPPPLILRERPPVPPPRVPSETITRVLPPVPLPPRSVVVERFPECPEKPRDIIIERWLPYEAQTERREIVHHAPPPMKYPAPTHTVIVYDAVEPNIVRKVERLGVARENPEAYMQRYGASLLDRDTLLRRARDAGVVEDISCSSSSSFVTPTPRENVVDVDRSNDGLTQGFSSSGSHHYGTVQRVTNTRFTNYTSRRYSSSSNENGYSAINSSSRELRHGYGMRCPDFVFSATIRCNGDTSDKEKRRYF